MSYSLEFMLPGLTKMSNQLLGAHWRTRSGHAKTWKRAVELATLYQVKPAQPLTSAVLSLTRVSSNEPDFDGLVSGFKPIIDALVKSGIIASDKVSCIGQPQYFWEKGKPKQGHLKIKVEQLKESV